MQRRHAYLATVGGLCGAILCSLFRFQSQDNGDFWWALHTAIALLDGVDPYAGTGEAGMVAYPLPIAAVGILFLWVPNLGASILFVGVSTGLLIYGALRDDRPWELAVLCSAAYFVAVQYTQWGIVIMALAHCSLLLPMIIIKPHVAIPVALTRKPSIAGILLTLVILLVSFLLLPDWPLRWLGTLGSYQRVIPLLVVPFGPLILITLLYWRDSNSWLLTLASILPHRAIYDVLFLWLCTRNWRQSCLLSALSWVVYALGPSNYAVTVVPLLFLPCVGMVIMNNRAARTKAVLSTQ